MLAIVYIEDNLSNLTLVERTLARVQGVKLIPAMQGQLGLELARRHRPDLVLLDLHLPDMEGREVLARLRQDPITREIPVVVVSADTTPGQIAGLLEDGATDYLTKPLDISRLLEIVVGDLGQ
jgi:CheY-like chemotaxis protein